MTRRPLVAVAAAVVLPAAPAEAKHDGCNTDPCEKRVAERFTPATASWYGPGLFGNRLGCGGTLWPSTLGVAHKALACGTRIRLCVRRCRTVAVVDRGPFVAGREFDLTAATAQAVGFSGVGVVRFRLVGR
jgi:rare lipoprotein A (peptidoglycan hydrolase)